MPVRTLVAALALAALAACAPKPEVPTADELAEWRRFADMEILCTVGDDCEIKWGRALKWMRRFGPPTIRIATDRLIDAQWGGRYVRGARLTVTQTQVGRALRRIELHIQCGGDACISAPDYSAEVFVLSTKHHFNRTVLDLWEND